jgi:acyl carrier protein
MKGPPPLWCKLRAMSAGALLCVLLTCTTTPASDIVRTVLVSGFPYPAQGSGTADASVPATLRSIIATELKISEGKVVATASFVKDLGADELALVELVMAYERAFKIAIPNADAEKFVQVRDVVAYLRKRGVLK